MLVLKIVVHELEPAHGGQTACEDLVDRTNYRKAGCDCLLDRSKVLNVNETILL